jgi:hypothetical protein
MIRNQFVDIDTNEDLYEKLKGKRISIQKEIQKLTAVRGNSIDLDEEKDEIEMNCDFSGLWYSEGLKYMLDIGKGFRAYLFPNAVGGKCVYELIPTEEMAIFELDLYQKEKEKLNIKISYKDCIQVFEGINEKRGPYDKYKEGEKLSYNDVTTEYHGVFWRLKPGFQANLLYKCVKIEIIDKEKDIRIFYFKKNTNLSKNLTFI